MMVVWLAVGIIGVSLAFLVPSPALNPWDPLNAAGLVALAYLAGLMAVTMRRPFPRRAKGLAWAVFLVVGTAIAFSWTGLERQVHFQVDQFSVIRHRIARGVINDQISTPLLQTLESYYQIHGTKKNTTIRSAFLRLYPGADVGTNLYRPTHERDSLMIIVTSIGDDAVSLVGQETNVPGRDPGFQNWDGRKGMIQYRATVTRKGVTYESEN